MAGEKNPTGNINTVNTAGVAIYDTAGFLKAARNGGKTDFNSLVDMVQDAQFSWIQKSGLLVTGQTRSNGSMMTYQVVSNDFELSARNAVLATKAAADVNAGSVSQTGIAMRFQVSVPASAINGPNDPALKTITPYDPTTLPKGGVIRFSSADYSKYYGTLGAFGLAGNFQTAKGDAYGYSIKNLGGNKIEVYAGPVNLLDAVNGVEASKAFLSAGISRHDQLAGAALNKAVFDIGTEQGKAAYQAFLLTGRMPEHDNKALGISGVRMIGYVSANSVSQLAAELEPGISPVPKLPEWDPWKLRDITGTLVTVTNPNTGKTD